MLTRGEIVKSILFLCTGNYYRSRFAEEYFNNRASAMGLVWRATSRGLRQSIKLSDHKNPIAEVVLTKLDQLGFSPLRADLFPRSVTRKDFEKAVQVIAMCEREHRPMIADLFPNYENLVDYWNIEDLPLLSIHCAFEKIQQHVNILLEKKYVISTPEWMEKNTIFSKK